jgi:succinoglycan biosynthesis transport protein ExoP
VEQTQALNIQRYLNLALKRRYLFAITTVAIITSVTVISYVLPPIYEAKTMVSVEKNFLNDVIKNIAGTQAQGPDDKAAALSLIMKSKTFVSKVIGDLGIDVQNLPQATVERLITDIQDRTKITSEFNRSGGRDVYFFTVSFQDKDPKFARDFVTNVVSKYIEENIGSKREGSFGANRFLLGEIDQFKEKVGKLDEEIAMLKKNQSYVLHDRLLELQKRRDNLLVQYTEQYPEVIKVEAEIAELKAKFKAQRPKKGVESGASSYQSGEQNTAALAGAAHVANQLAVLERERESSKTIYDQLASAYGKSELSSQAELQDKAGTFRIVDPAVLPVKPVSPNRIKIILLGVLGGIAGAFALIVFIDALDKSVKDVETLKSLGIPVLAIIPHIEDSAELVRTRRKDIVLFILSGLFITLLSGVIVRELFALRG